MCFKELPFGGPTVTFYLCVIYVLLNCLLYPEIDECLSDPCGNGGNCSDQLGAFRCACQAGYGGDTCQVGEFHLLPMTRHVVFSWE